MECLKRKFIEDTDMNRRMGQMLAVLLMALVSSMVWADEPTELIEKAENGDANAQYLLGKYYSDEQEFAKAVEWWQKAADQGNIEAQYELGRCYENGCGVKKNLFKAIDWYALALYSDKFQAPEDASLLFFVGPRILGLLMVLIIASPLFFTI